MIKQNNDEANNDKYWDGVPLNLSIWLYFRTTELLRFSSSSSSTNRCHGPVRSAPRLSSVFMPVFTLPVAPLTYAMKWSMLLVEPGVCRDGQLP